MSASRRRRRDDSWSDRERGGASIHAGLRRRSAPVRLTTPSTLVTLAPTRHPHNTRRLRHQPGCSTESGRTGLGNARRPNTVTRRRRCHCRNAAGSQARRSLLLHKQTHAPSSEVRRRHLASGRRGPQRSEDTHRPAGGRVLITDGGGFSNKPERISIVVMRRGFQRLGPSPGGGAERGRDRCCSGDVVLLCLAGTAPEVAEYGFGVCGSRSRMRHHRAAAGWSSGRGPAAAADRTSRVASKPAQVRLLNLSVSCGRNGSEVVLGTSAASSCRHRHSVRVSAAASRMSSCCCQTRAARPSWGGSRLRMWCLIRSPRDLGWNLMR